MDNRLEQKSPRHVPPRFPLDSNRPSTYEPDARASAAGAASQRGARTGDGGEVGLGVALACLSIGLGVAQLLAPRTVARTAGLPNWPWLMRAIGARELACGIGLLAQPKSPVWRWSRVAGDAMDMALIGAAAFTPASQRRRLVATAAFAGSVAALDLRAGARRRRMLSSEALPGAEGRRRVQESITVNRSPEECYRAWHDFESFPTFMQHIESVQLIDEKRSHWRALGLAGTRVEWDAEITEDRPGEAIAWHSVEGAGVHHSGVVRFAPAPGGKGTVLRVVMEYKPPGGAVGAAAAMLFGQEPSQQIEGDLRRFKQLLECGEITTTKGQPHGPRTLKSRLFNKGVEE